LPRDAEEDDDGDPLVDDDDVEEKGGRGKGSGLYGPPRLQAVPYEVR